MEKVKYISLSKRLVAFILDYVMIVVISAIVIGLMILFLSLKDDTFATLVMLIVSLLYFTLMESSSRQATLGKARMKIKVVNSNGEQLTFLNALGRYLGKYLSLLIAGFGFLMIPFTKKKQALHDMLAKTYVVNIENYEEYIQQQNQKISTKMFAFLSFAMMGILLMFLLTSMLTSQIAKDVGNFFALAIGGIIWVGIFYALYKMKNSSAGQSLFGILSKFGDIFKETEEEKRKREERKAKEGKKKNPQGTDSDNDREKEVGQIILLIKELSFTDRKRHIMKKGGKFFVRTPLGDNNIYAENLDEIQVKALSYFSSIEGVERVDIKIYDT